jgi:flavin-binding protein dodecin
VAIKRRILNPSKEDAMAVVKVIELIGISEESWEDAARNAVMEAAKTVSNIVGLEVVGQTARVEDGKITTYKANVKLAFEVREER